MDLALRAENGVMAKILVVDDDFQIRTLVRVCLEEAGHRVFEAADGTVGITTYHVQRPDIVISDIYMPQMEGLQFIRELRTLYGDVKVIAISGGSKFVPGDFLAMALELGAKIALDKPFGPNDLLRAVNSLLPSHISA